MRARRYIALSCLVLTGTPAVLRAQGNIFFASAREGLKSMRRPVE